MAIAAPLLTAEEFRLLPDPGQPCELVRGNVVMMVRPGFRHGKVCVRVARLLGDFVEQRDLGEVIGNDAGVVTEKNPDTVRGPDIAYYSFTRVPRGSDPVGYPNAAPDVVFEVLSPHDRWADLLAKVGEYLAAGVQAVCVLDPELKNALVCRADRQPQALAPEADLDLPEVHAEFRVRVARFFG
ncbi:MAG: Uma2 family endonuclease [Pirellulales bacterium]